MEPNLKALKAIVYDIDGVLTNGMIIPIGPSPEDLVRIVDAKDSFASRVASSKGFIIGIISGGETEALLYRCRHMGADKKNIHLGVRGKLKVFWQFCKENSLNVKEVAYFGDDIPDIQVLRECGVGFVPADAVEEAKEAADIVCSKGGGHGCLREGIEMILKAQDKWHFDEDKFHEIY